MINHRRARAVFAATLVLALVSAFANAVQAASEGAFQGAFDCFIAASGGDRSAIDKAADAFDALHSAEPANPVLTAYAGASTTLKASTTVLPWKRLAYAEDGLAMVDRALSMLVPASDAPVQHGTPGSLEVRFVAANTFLAVPDFMNRSARGAKLLRDVLDNPLFATAPLPFRGTVWMRAAALALKEQRTQDARGLLNEVIAQGAPQAGAAKAKLKELAT